VGAAREGATVKARIVGLCALAVAGIGLVTAGVLWPAEAPEVALARRILEATGVRGGLVVHVGCGDGKLTAALRPGQGWVAHGLDADATSIRRARAHIESLGLYGPVSVERWTAARLPYADNLVNLLVWTDRRQPPMAEVMRVLAPEGVAYVRNGTTWARTVKPRPGNTDEWTHYLHDASGNAVAHDEVVGPPGSLQWTADPPHTRGHEYVPSIFAVVSSGGRIFYVADQGPIASVRERAQWWLMARDAYNGVLLWQRPIEKWYPHVLSWAQTPAQMERRLVAVGDRVYATLGLYAPVSAIDAATGETLRDYEGTEGTEEIVCDEGVLLLATRRVTDERVAERDKLDALGSADDSPLYRRETAQPLADSFRRTTGQAAVAILALDAETGRTLWRKEAQQAAGLRPLSLCAGGDRVFFQRAGNVACLDRTTGQELWAVPGGPLRLVYEGRAFCADGKAVTALSIETGQTLWTGKPLLTQVQDVFVAGGSLWLGGFRPWEGPDPNNRRGPAWGAYYVSGYDPTSGGLLRHLEPENPGHHHRCYSNKATDRYILGGRRGTEFIDLASGEVLWHSWARGVCRYGVMPCNGLLYVPPHSCGCYIGAKLMGFNALGPRRAPAEALPGQPAVERGPAYDAPSPAARPANEGDWPTYRRDAERSACTPTAVPADLRLLWQAEPGGRLTSPTVAEGKVVVGSADKHQVTALEADSGRRLWAFTAGGRVDSAPTLHRGRVLFGSHDGCAYSVRMSDGALAWRSRAAREERRIVACGQVEAASPVIGSVLVRDGIAYGTAGRSSYLDGGIDLFRLDPRTGKMLSRTPIYSPDPKTGRQPAHLGPATLPGARADVLSADEGRVYLRDLAFDPSGAEAGTGRPHLLTLTGFLDDSWPHRSYWIFGTKPSVATGCSSRDRNLVYGRLLVFGGTTIYGYGRKTVHWSNQLEDGPYRLFATERSAEGVARWERPVPLQVRAMILAGDRLFLAGPAVEGGDWVRPGGKASALLLVVSAADGSELARQQLPAFPAFDGMAAARGKLYVSTTDGRVLCLGGQA
jgi:outer membrane protein assembly factor BamB